MMMEPTRIDGVCVPQTGVPALAWTLIHQACETYIELERRRRRGEQLRGKPLAELWSVRNWLRGADAKVPLSLALEMLSPVLVMSAHKLRRACEAEIDRRERAREGLTLPYVAR